MPTNSSIALRAVLALVLLVGFYLLALGIAAGLLAIVYFEVREGRRVHVKLAIVCIASAGAILWSILPRLDRFVPPGPRLDHGEHPELFKLLRAVARAAGQEMPADVYLFNEVNAWVRHRGGIMGFGAFARLGRGELSRETWAAQCGALGIAAADLGALVQERACAARGEEAALTREVP
jgi:heat shock protein HtpX